jgi:outer membrane murein-binding lipoprotein Lpp
MSKTEVSGKQIKDGSIELVDLSNAVATDISTLKSDVATLQTDVAAKADAGNLASVATSGSYNDLADKPTIPSVAGLASETYVDTAVAGKADSASLASVATSGSYNDLANKPSLFSGDYDDLANKPTIPSVAGLASETYVDTAVAGVVNSAPAVLDTLNELSAALGNDENFATTVAGQIGDVASDVSGLDTRVTALEGDIGTLQSASAPNLSDLGEVAITSPSSGQVLKYDGLGWVNAADSTFSGAYADLTGKPTLFDGAYSSLAGAPSLATVATSGSYADLSNKPTIPSTLDDLSDVAISSPSSDQVLKYNGTAWVNSAAPASGATNLDGLSDVVITSPASTHHLRYNGTNWVNAVIPASDLPVANQSSGILDTGFQIINGEKRFASTMQVNAMASFGTAISISGGQSGTFAGGKIVCGGAATTGYMDFFTKVNGQQFQELKRANISDAGLFSMYYGASIESGAAATKGLIVKGAASQSANLLELQDSAGAALASVSSGGAATFNGGVRLKAGGIYDTSNLGATFGVTGTGTFGGSNYTHSFYGATNQPTMLVGSSGIYPAIVCSNGVNEIFRTSQYGTSITPRSFETWAVALTVNNNHANPTTIANFQSNSVTKVSIGKSGDITASGTVHALRYTETVANAFNTSLAPSSGTLTVDTSVGNAVLGALSASVTTWAFTNVPTDNSKVTSVTAVLAGNASYTYGDACSVNGSAVTNGIMWSGGSAPTPTSNTDIITFIIVRDSAGTIKVFGSATTNFS